MNLLGKGYFKFKINLL